ncbi:FLUCTUATING-LIGHT-ACCLIMATION protein 1, chloroplastic isoform X3 [Elaeis guineensis]|uniref:FLUCTUATING-LIGHT-ACCLIMATION protein 1, chloroplastic isoform X3 n=1 Tax=Elaeis guineensis var. tenera TaxID=51953 RepID=UPI003C6CFC18
MATGSILETPVLLREPSKFRPRPNPFFHKFQSRLPLSLPTSHKFMRVSIQSVPNPMAALRPCAAAAYSSLEERNKFARAVLETLRALRKSAIAVIFLGFLLTADPLPALAASGGRMGGSAFSSSSRSHSSSSSSRSHSSSSLHSYSRPSISSFSYSVPYYAPSPFGAGGGLVRAVGVGFNSEGGFILLMFCFAAVILLAGIISDQRDGGSVLADTQKTSVLKLQVGLLGMARSLQKDLDRIAETADTSTPEGLSYVLTETTLALLRHPDCCISAYSSNFADVGEAGVEGIASAVGTCKESLNRSWGCSGKILRRSSQYSASTEMEHSNGILAEFQNRV